MVKNQIKSANDSDPIFAFREKILNWYDRHRRVLPWRALPGEKVDPYKIWLSEVMLQQTTVQAVVTYFLKFTEKWPTVHDLADAPNAEIMHEWAGLGYYARARNLHKCAQIISREYGGIFPSEQQDLKKLPGIGEYTSAAIAAIAFNKTANVVDGNVERVIARYHAVQKSMPEAKPELKKFAGQYALEEMRRPGDYAQSLMDLGATICTPKSPTCVFCPVNERCAAFRLGLQNDLPIKAVKKTKPQRFGYVYWVENEKGEILVERRPEKGLLGGMLAFPTTSWTAQNELDSLEEFRSLQNTDLFITHSFTHFDLKLLLFKAELNQKSTQYYWIDKERLKDVGMPTVFSKVRNLVL